jgi:hypothetical protein
MQAKLTLYAARDLPAVLAITSLSVRNYDYQQMRTGPTHHLFVALASIVIASALERAMADFKAQWSAP